MLQTLQVETICQLSSLCRLHELEVGVRVWCDSSAPPTVTSSHCEECVGRSEHGWPEAGSKVNVASLDIGVPFSSASTRAGS